MNPSSEQDDFCSISPCPLSQQCVCRNHVVLEFPHHFCAPLPTITSRLKRSTDCCSELSVSSKRECSNCCNQNKNSVLLNELDFFDFRTLGWGRIFALSSNSCRLFCVIICRVFCWIRTVDIYLSGVMATNCFVKSFVSVCFLVELTADNLIAK